MNAAQLTIAKAGLLAALLKPDAGADLAPCSRDEIEQLHGLLSATAARCSPANVQKCKQWMLKHVVLSSTRTVAVIKYMVAFSESQQQQSQQAQQQAGDVNNGTEHKPSAKRRRLHLLYIINDVLHHVKRRIQSTSLFVDAAPRLPALLKSAASFPKAPKHQKKLLDLVQLWQQEKYFSDTDINVLRAAVAEGPRATDPTTTDKNGATRSTAASSTSAREASFVLPSTHGDTSAPWYDLPAANWLPAIEPNSTRPMNPSMIKPLRLAGGPADKDLVDAVKKLLGDVDKIYARTVQYEGDSSLLDLSQMGELLERDELGDLVGGETYYGWSKAFCEKMKTRRKNNGLDRGRGHTAGSSRSDSRRRSYSRDRSSSTGSSGPAFKRRRFSDSSRSRSPSQSRSRSRSGSQGRSRAARRHHDWSRSRSRRTSRTRQRSGSYSPAAAAQVQSRSPSRLEGQQRHVSRGSYSPTRALGQHPTNTDAPVINKGAAPSGFIHPTHPQQQQQHFQQPHPPLGIPSFHGGVFNLPPHLNGGVVPPPPPPPNMAAWNIPPPPPNYQGHWPPPPMHAFPGVPPPGSGLPQPTVQGWFPSNAGISPPPPMAGLSQPEWGGGWVPPPPPPPQQPPSGGRGYGGRGDQGGPGARGNAGYRGRSAYGRGRGW
ncbi:hypothetical protein BD289DRAFT_423322 [Coniella lustricola]|uniref:CID domain-containing protein n=1 Tax=Coniella lustricola TaxID=2025994 RepID=A0A2T3AJX5_9PEZI|nr:hypothetical protein BD289DRAFT_423322 [Coniella lustricola]